jgi:1,2-phenylacetyl-CoA epoxidase catalytic subunit
MRNFGSTAGLSRREGISTMQAAIDRVMRTYGMMFNLTAEEERTARERVSQFLADKAADENQLAIEGLRYLRTLQPPL